MIDDKMNEEVKEYQAFLETLNFSLLSLKGKDDNNTKCSSSGSE